MKSGGGPPQSMTLARGPMTDGMREASCASPPAFAARHSAASARRRLALWARRGSNGKCECQRAAAHSRAPQNRRGPRRFPEILIEYNSALPYSANPPFHSDHRPIPAMPLNAYAGCRHGKATLNRNSSSATGTRSHPTLVRGARPHLPCQTRLDFFTLWYKVTAWNRTGRRTICGSSGP